MTETETPKRDVPGRAFMFGQGPIGAMLMDIDAGLCLRIDDSRWSMDTSRGNVVLSHTIVERLLKSGWVSISPRRIMDRENLQLTYKGRSELVEWALSRSIELAAENAPSGVVIDEARPPVTTQARIYDLARKALEVRALSHGEMIPTPWLYVQLDNDKHVHIGEWLKGAPDDKPGTQMARLFGLLQLLAVQAMSGLTIGDMPARARWASTIAAEAFERAPDQDWELEGEDAEGEG